MRRTRPGFAMFCLMMMMLFVGVGNLIRYSDHGRFVDFLGISGSGATIGAAIVGMVGCWLVFTGKLQLAERKPAEEQSPITDARTDRSQS